MPGSTPAAVGESAAPPPLAPSSAATSASATPAATPPATAPAARPTASPEIGFLASVLGDLRTRGRGRLRPGIVLGSFLTRGFLVVFLHRIARALGRVPGIAPLCRRLGVLVAGASIHESASIAPGLILPHPHGVVIGRHVRIGRGVFLFQGVTLGPRNVHAIDEAPTIGDNCHLYPWSSVLGPVTVGRNCEIGIGCAVFHDLPAESVVFPPAPTVLRGMPFQMRGYDAPPPAETR